MNNDVWFVAALYITDSGVQLYHDVFDNEESADNWIIFNHPQAKKTAKAKGTLEAQ